MHAWIQDAFCIYCQQDDVNQCDSCFFHWALDHPKRGAISSDAYRPIGFIPNEEYYEKQKEKELKSLHQLKEILEKRIEEVDAKIKELEEDK